MVRSIAADLLTGFVALGLVMAGLVTGTPGPNLRFLVIVVGSLFLPAGLFRASAPPPSPRLKVFFRSWSRASLVVVGSSVVSVVLVANGLVPMILERASTRHVNASVPAFSFATISGQVTHESLRGRVAVLAFWASWCAPCREELPRLNTLYQRQKNQSDVASGGRR